MADLLARKYHVHEIPAGASRRVRHDGRSYPTTCGHRDAGRTSCPGQQLYAPLPAIRRQIERRS